MVEFYVRKIIGLRHNSDLVMNGRFEDNYLRFSWVDPNNFDYDYTKDINNFELISENGYFLIKADEKYLGVKNGKNIFIPPMVSYYEKWICGTEKYDNSHYFILEENNDVTEGIEVSGHIGIQQVLNKDLYYIIEKNSGKYLYMNDDGWINLNGEGYYLLVKK